MLVPDWLPLPPFSPLCAHPKSRPRARRSLASCCLLAPASLPRVPPQGACRPAPLRLLQSPRSWTPRLGNPSSSPSLDPCPQSRGSQAFQVGVSPGPLVGVGGGFQASVASAGGLLHDVLVAEGAEGAPGTQSPGWNSAASSLPEGDAPPVGVDAIPRRTFTGSHAQVVRGAVLRTPRVCSAGRVLDVHCLHDPGCGCQGRGPWVWTPGPARRGV